MRGGMRRLVVGGLFSTVLVIACQGEGPSEDVGVIQLAVSAAPGGVGCLRVNVAGATRTATRTLAVTPGVAVNATLSGLPSGAVTITADAFAESCAAVTASAVATWVGDPIAVTLSAVPVPVQLVMRQNGRISLSVEWDTSGAGGSGGGGAAGSGGASGDAMAAAAILDGQAWVLHCGPTAAGTQRVCTNPAPGNTLPHSDPLAGAVNRNDRATFGGIAGQPYCVTVRVRGIVEAKNYATDTMTSRSGTPYGIAGSINFGATADANQPDGTNGWVAGGMPANGNDYAVYSLLVGSPTKIFYLNSINTAGTNRLNHTTYPIDYVASFDVNGGSSLQFILTDFNRNAIRNCAEPNIESVCNPQVLSPLPMIVNPSSEVDLIQPHNGQLAVMTVTSARTGTCDCSEGPANCR
jgi:hypothetical protein